MKYFDKVVGSTGKVLACPSETARITITEDCSLALLPGEALHRGCRFPIKLKLGAYGVWGCDGATAGTPNMLRLSEARHHKSCVLYIFTGEEQYDL